MLRNGFFATLTSLLVVSLGSAQTDAWRFRWQAGQVLTYRVEQITAAADTMGESKAETTTTLNNVKRWQVLGVDAAGVATLQLSLVSLRIETKPPSGDALVFDSANPDKSDAQMREQLSKYVGVPLAVLRMDAQGRVLEVKESKFGPASKFESELPFILVLPAVVPSPGQGWQRPYRITLEPPQGTGEKYDAVQQYVFKSVSGATATVTLATTVTNPPAAVADQIPLLQLQPQGEIVFDTRAGVVRSVRWQIDKELKGHQGEGSSYRFQSTYKEEYVAGQ
jgi:hypothetical protein